MTKRENDDIWTAAEKANRQCGQWMPQRWIEVFIKELASVPPATPPGVGADGIARAFEAGALAVHNEWCNALDRGESDPPFRPDFSEAARDYALTRAAEGK